MSEEPNSTPQLDTNALLKMVIELGPLVAFFTANSFGGIFWGTGVFMVATILSLSTSFFLFGRIATMPLVTGVFVLIFGMLTIILHNDLFIKMKPTVVNTLFSLILFGGLFFGQSFLKVIFAEAFQLTETGWRILTIRWAGFFLFLAVLNEVIWRNFSTDFWVSFKVFGLMPLTIAFAIAQVGLLKRHELQEPSDPK